MWEDGRVVVDGVLYCYEAKVFKEGSKFGINGGRVSKMYAWKPSARSLNDPDYVYTSRPILSYDRGWITDEPKEGSFETKLLETVLAAIEMNKGE